MAEGQLLPSAVLVSSMLRQGAFNLRRSDAIASVRVISSGGRGTRDGGLRGRSRVIQPFANLLRTASRFCQYLSIIVRRLVI